MHKMNCQFICFPVFVYWHSCQAGQSTVLECDHIRLSQMQMLYLCLSEFHPLVHMCWSSGDHHKSSVTEYDGTFDLSTLLMIGLKGKPTC